jgi:hypothetical protein
MTGELIVLWVAVSSTVESIFGCLPGETFRMQVMGEVVAKFQRLEELCLRPGQLGTRICDLLLDPPLGQARWVDRVDEAIGWLAVELVARWEVDAELEALRTSAA